MMKQIIKIFVAVAAVFLMIPAALAGELQIRGTACESGDISMTAVTLNKLAYVVKIESTSGIFCILKTSGGAGDVSEAGEIICTDYEIKGEALTPGTYRVFPYLQPDKAMERVIIYLR
jgi:hypothetical protein